MLLPAIVIFGLFAAYRLGWRGGREPLVVYCAHDSVYSEKILRNFEQRTGIPVSVRFDTEATKSLGLVELIQREKDHPRCDVFWNNELLGTLSLQEQGLLAPYRGAGYARIPAAFKDADGYWAGFAARMRVYIVNTAKVTPTIEAVQKALAGNLSRVAIAKPLYGTTQTHYTVLWHLWGGERMKAWHHDWRARGVREVAGNAMVKDLVAEGVCDLGLTDTDDFFDAKDGGKPVAMLPVLVDAGDDRGDQQTERIQPRSPRAATTATICIPNTIAIIRGTRHLAVAQKLVDYLLSEECELALANSKSRQIPLGPVDEVRLSDEVRALKKWVQAPTSVHWSELSRARAECLAWLKAEYVR